MWKSKVLSRSFLNPDFVITTFKDVIQRSWIVCVSVCVSKTRSIYALNSQGPVRTNNITRTLLFVRMCNSTKFLLYFIVLHLGPTKFIRPLLMENFSEFSNLQIYRKQNYCKDCKVLSGKTCTVKVTREDVKLL